MTHPNDEQIGGSHYRPAGADNYQVWDFIADAEMDYFTGSAFAYVARAHLKGNEKEDLRKAGHYVRKLISLIEQPKYADNFGGTGHPLPWERFCATLASIPPYRLTILNYLHRWACDVELLHCLSLLEDEIATLT